MAVVVVRGLHKSYGEVVAVDGIDLEVGEREVVALLGPNGAGKTTTVEILEGYRRRDAGTVEVLGIDPSGGGRVYRERIGIVLQEAGFEEQFSVRELVRLQAGFYPHPRAVDDTIELVGLAEKADARVGTLSGGQRRRLDLALGIVGSPEVLFLDEPTTGFDPTARRRAWDLVDALRDLGTTILLTTHYMDEAEHLADRLVVLARGRVVAQGTAEGLAEASGVHTEVSFRLPTGIAPSELPSVGLDRSVEAATAGSTRGAPGAGTVTITSTSPTADVHALTSWALDRGLELADLRLSRPDLEDVYLRLVAESGEAAPDERPDVDPSGATRP